MDWLDYKDAIETGEEPSKKHLQPNWIEKFYVERKKVTTHTKQKTEDTTEEVIKNPPQHAYESGVKAAEEGKALTDNPYGKDDPLREMWIDGFSSYVK